MSYSYEDLDPIDHLDNNEDNDTYNIDNIVEERIKPLKYFDDEKLIEMSIEIVDKLRMYAWSKNLSMLTHEQSCYDLIFLMKQQ
jgi:hypothetical protein